MALIKVQPERVEVIDVGAHTTFVQNEMVVIVCNGYIDVVDKGIFREILEAATVSVQARYEVIGGARALYQKFFSQPEPQSNDWMDEWYNEIEMMEKPNVQMPEVQSDNETPRKDDEESH